MKEGVQYLSEIRTKNKGEIEIPVYWGEVCATCAAGAVEVEAGRVAVVMNHALWILAAAIPPALLWELKEKLIHINHRYFKAFKYHRTQKPGSPYRFNIWTAGEWLVINKGAGRMVFSIMQKHGLDPQLVDDLPHFVTIRRATTFSAALYPAQREALEDLERRRFGILQGAVGSGKKVTALALVGRRHKRTLFICSRRETAHRLRDDARRFMPGASVGLAGAGECDLDADIVIGVSRTLYRHVDLFQAAFGMVVVVDCDRADLKVFKEIVFPMEADFVLGLASGPRAQDAEFIQGFVGPVVHTMRSEGFEAVESRPYLRVRTTSFHYRFNDDFGDLLGELVRHEDRNYQIVRDVMEGVGGGERVLVLAARVDHMETLRLLLADRRDVEDCEVISGRISKTLRVSAAGRFNAGKSRVAMMTPRTFETMDIERVDRLVIASPFRPSPNVLKCVADLMTRGRLSRGVIIDYYDNPGVLKASFNSRKKAFLKMGAIRDER